MAPRTVRNAPAQEEIIEGAAVDLAAWPIQTCWPEDVGPLITWGLTTTRGPLHDRQNLGIYRQQVIGRNKIIMRWLAHRGGATDYQAFRERHPGERFPVAVSVGADPATILAAVTPIPNTLSEYAFAGLLRSQRSEVVKALGSDLLLPATAEITLEGYIEPGEEAQEGPFGDHTGYYNETERFPVMTVERITHRRDRTGPHKGHVGKRNEVATGLSRGARGTGKARAHAVGCVFAERDLAAFGFERQPGFVGAGTHHRDDARHGGLQVARGLHRDRHAMHEHVPQLV